MQPSFDLITVSHKKQKEGRTKTTLKAREFAYIVISRFIFLVAFKWLLLGRKEAGNRRVRVLYRRISAATFIKSIVSHGTCADKMPLCSCYIYMLFTGREVRIGKTCARGLEYGPRPQAEGRTRDRGHSFSQYGPTKAGE